MLPVFDQSVRRRSGERARRSVRDIPVEAICATTEPNRAAQFDENFRPAPITRCRWQRVWEAEQRGTPLPPVSVVQADGGYALRDGHHRVSVARARGAATIRAVVEAA
jgi:hypothetical protein